MFNTIAAAVTAATPLDTIHVFGGVLQPCETCPPEEYIYDEQVLLGSKAVCLVAVGADFWDESPTRNMRYPATIRSTTSQTWAVQVQPGGSGSCVQGFRIVHRGGGSGAVIVGSSASASTHAENVTIVDNLIDLSSAITIPGPSTPAAVTLAGKGNHVHRNVMLGKTDGSGQNIEYTRGVQVHWANTDASACADWDGNQITANHISRFDMGVDWFMNIDRDCGNPPWTGNRIDLNDISGCGVAIRAAGASPVLQGDALSRLIVMNNKITAGEPWLAATDFCQPDLGSQGIALTDSHRGEIIGNSITGVQFGVHLGYSACYSRVKDNKIRVEVAGIPAVKPAAILVCPSDCNFLVDNELSADNVPATAAIDFTNRSDVPCPNTKPHGAHVVDGGILHDVGCATRRRATATVTLGRLPARAALGDIDCTN